MAAFGAAALLWSGLCFEPRAAAEDSGTQKLSRAAFAQRSEDLEALVRACAQAANACERTPGPDTEVAADGPVPGFTVRWDWLSKALQDARKAKPEDRARAMTGALAHLEALRTDADSDAASLARNKAGFGRAQAEAARVLAQSEFRKAAAGPTWWEQQVAKLWMWVGRLLTGIGQATERAPWLGTLLEWAFFIAAAVGLLLFVRRSFSRHRLAIALNSGAGELTPWGREATDWARDAEAYAAAGEWRDAVHCLYWAAIVKLEARRAWRHNPARTPREYVRLLKPGSPQRSALHRLTGVFERVWYGLRDAGEADYQRARQLFDGLADPSGQKVETP